MVTETLKTVNLSLRGYQAAVRAQIAEHETDCYLCGMRVFPGDIISPYDESDYGRTLTDFRATHTDCAVREELGMSLSDLNRARVAGIGGAAAGILLEKSKE